MRRGAYHVTGAALLFSVLAAACIDDSGPARVAAPQPSARPAAASTLAAAASAAPADSSAPAPDPSAAATSTPTDPPPDNRPRIGSIRWITYIWPAPARPKDTLPIGAIRYGTAAVLKSTEPVPGSGCVTKWYAIEPMG